MLELNTNFFNLEKNYLFSNIAQKVNNYKQCHPDKKLISLGIGDVTLPLPKVCISAMHSAVSELSDSKTFKGYGPEQGYFSLRDKISKYDYKNLNISSDEIFISDGAKCDLGRILDLFCDDLTVAITDPVYPVYVDTNIISNNKIIYLPMNIKNGFTPPIPSQKVDIIYLCFPNNPTGIALNKKELSKWINYAKENNSIILFDSAYEAFITTPDIPHSIYEIDGAKDVAIEFRSFSKTAGFTGIRCGYTIIPNELTINNVKVIDLYKRLISTKFNGASYISQKAAEALYSSNGMEQVRKNIEYYLNNARIIKNSLDKKNILYYGGVDSPYIWLQIPNNIKSWDFFDLLLENANIIGTPGVGFGSNGEGFFRLTGFNTLENTITASSRLEAFFNLR